MTLPLATLGRATGIITGTVVASDNGTGLAVDASSTLVQVTGAGLTGPIQGTTDPTGTYTIVGVPVNPAGTPYTLSASKPNYVAAGTTTATPVAGTTVTASSTITLEVAVTSVTGTVVVPQPPATDSSGVTATLAGVAFGCALFAPTTTAMSSSSGVYTFTNNVPPGTYSVMLSLYGYAPAIIPRVVVVAGSTATVATTTLVRPGDGHNHGNRGRVGGHHRSHRGPQLGAHPGDRRGPDRSDQRHHGKFSGAHHHGRPRESLRHAVDGHPSKANYVAAGTTTATRR